MTNGMVLDTFEMVSEMGLPGSSAGILLSCVTSIARFMMDSGSFAVSSIMLALAGAGIGLHAFGQLLNPAALPGQGAMFRPYLRTD